MNVEKFYYFLQETKHTEKSIISRISSLKKVESLFYFNIDLIIEDKDKVLTLLREINIKGLDTKNQKLSNSIRKYYECITGDKIQRGEV